MYRRVLNGRLGAITLAMAACLMVTASPVRPETNIRSEATLKIADLINRTRFTEAIIAARQLADDEPTNPAGTFLVGSIYQTLSELYRTDRFVDTISQYLDSAIKLANQRKVGDPDNADWYFISGAAHGYRGIFRAFHGNWFGGFRDGLSCSSDLSRSLRLDTTFHDAYYGLGAYHYWRTIKSKVFLWLPFVSDDRERGISEIKRAVAQGYLSSYDASEALLRIYLNEGRLDDLIGQADSLMKVNARDPYTLLYYAEGLLAAGRLDDAEEEVRQLRNVWKKSPFFDPLGLYEAELISARIFFERGDKETARKIVEKIMSDAHLARSNAYFAETVEKTEDFAPKLK